MDRRKLLQFSAVAAAGLASAEYSPLLSFGASKSPAQITVDKLEVFRVTVNRRGNWILPRLTTSAGVSGIGDASQSGATDEVQLMHLQRCFERLKGRDIFSIEWLRREALPEIASHGLPAAAAFSALEQCLWDIIGKVLGVPVYDLLGGRINFEIRNYANINRSTDDRTPEGFAQMAGKAVEAGFDAVKLAPFDDMPREISDAATWDRYTQLGIDCAAAVRTVLGPQRDLLVDVHSHFDLQHGLDLLHRFEPLNLFWLEEVTPAKPIEPLAAINQAAKMPTAGGEMVLGVKGFYAYIKAGAVDIIMPDVKYCGGILELKKIAALAEGAGLQVAPHGPASPVGNVAAAHVASTIPNFPILEFSYGEVPWRAEVINPPEQLSNGRITLSDRPGFGITLNEKTIAKHRAV